MTVNHGVLGSSPSVGAIWFGGDGIVDTPVPIPNTEVKHYYADGSTLRCARVGSCQANMED